MEGTPLKFAFVGAAGILCLLLRPLTSYAQTVPNKPNDAVIAFQKLDEARKKRIIESEERWLKYKISLKRPRSPFPWENRPAPKTPYHNPTVFISAADLRRFDSSFAALSSRYHVAFFAEGQPLQPALDKKGHEALASALTPDKQVVLSQAVEQIAEAFDYQAFRSDENTFLLLKRYSDPNDIPFVTFDEAIAAFTQIKRVLSVLDPHVVPPNQTNSPLYQLMGSLRDQYGADTFIKGVPVSELSPERQQLLYRYNLSSFLTAQQGETQYALPFLLASQDPRSVFRKVNLLTLPIPVLIYEGPFLTNQAHQHFMQEYALSHGFTMQHGGVNIVKTTQGFGLVTSSLSEPQRDKYQALAQRKITKETLPDPDAPTPNDYLPLPEPPCQATITLAALCEKIRPLVGSGQTVSVDQAVATKTVSVFGSTLLSPEAVLQNAAYVYGLRLQHKSDSQMVLTLPAPAPARTLEEVAERVEQATPLPWRRALLSGAAFDEAEKNAEEAKLVERGEILFDPWSKGRNNRESVDRRQKALYRAAVRRLRVLIEPKINAAFDKRYPMRNMTEEESRLFALIGTAEFLPRLKAAMERLPPPSLQNWKMAYVRGGDLPQISSSPVLFIGVQKEGGFFFDVEFILRPQMPPQESVPANP